jgi:Tol biopolymer transport system component
VKLSFLVLGASLLCSHSLRAQEIDFAHPELDWFTIETDHFYIHFHNGAERTAKEVARIAEQIYGPITDLYQHKPDQKVSFVIRDHDDYSNGAAYFYDNKIEIWASALDFELRGIHPWLQNVVTHEFTHIVQIQTAMKLGRRVPAVYFQWLGYESERRPDVLYGYPNVIVSYPLSAFIVPSWFAEGVAQYNHPDLTYDAWDSHRDMILRMYMLDGNLLSWEEMAVFGKTSLGNEAAYNAGFSIVRYVAEKYGAATLKKISDELASPLRLTIDGAIENVLGKSGEELYEEWQNDRRAVYRARAEQVKKNLREGEIIETEGFGNFYPQFSPDGSKVAYVSNKGSDYFAPSSVYLYDLATKQTQKIVDNVRSTVSFSRDGRYLYYSKATRDNPHWSKFFDLYRFDIHSGDEIRLTHGWRAGNPRISSDGSKLVFTSGSDGTLNISVADADAQNFRRVTNFHDGEQVFTPVFSPDGRTIAFGYSKGHKQSLATINIDGSDFKLLSDDSDSRNPCFSRDGKTLYYASDRSSIFNIYALNLETGESNQVTNVLGGAFLPTTDSAGNVAFASYTSSGYKIAFMKRSGGSRLAEDEASEKVKTQVVSTLPSTHQESALSNDEGSSNAAAATPSSKKENGVESRPYGNIFTSLSMIPFVRFDNYNSRNSGIDNVKPGLYFTSGDVLEKVSLFGGAAINRNFERDLFLIFQYRDKIPLLYSLGWDPTVSLELYNLTRKTGNSFELYPYLINVDVTYNLFEFDVVLTQRMFTENNDLRLSYTLSRYSADIGSFTNPFDPSSLNPAFNHVYLIGNAFSAAFKHNGIRPSVDRDINPEGRTVLLKYSFELNKFNPNGDYELVHGILVPVYERFDFHKIEASWAEHIPALWDKHTLTFGVRAAGILGPNVDEFFDFYAGGFGGMRGYPFYAIGGNEMASVQLNYRFPISTSLDFRFLQFYFKKLFGSFFGDIGNAWSGEAPAFKEWKKDAGFELRLEAYSFYAYPTRFFFSGAYGFDQYTRKFSGVDVTYGKEWRFYLGVLFGFEIGELGK